MGRTLVLCAAASLLVASCGDGDTISEAEFRIETHTAPPGRPVAFTASGDAVDHELLCPTGESSWVQTLHADTGLPETLENPPVDGELLWVDVRFTCDDGTGDFVLRADATVDVAELESVIASGDLSSEHPLSVTEGTGDYTDLRVEASRHFSVVTPGEPEAGFYDVFVGTLTRD